MAAKVLASSLDANRWRNIVIIIRTGAFGHGAVDEVVPGLPRTATATFGRLNLGLLSGIERVPCTIGAVRHQVALSGPGAGIERGQHVLPFHGYFLQFGQLFFRRAFSETLEFFGQTLQFFSLVLQSIQLLQRFVGRRPDLAYITNGHGRIHCTP